MSDTEPSLLQPPQSEMPFAMVLGKEVTEMPKDLYIPPDALEIFLEAFEGPLDLLLYLIRRQNIDILEVNVATITRQYIEYVGLMKSIRFELAAEYLLMSALLAEIKTRTLLPRQPELEDHEEDPRAQLILKLQEYERYKEAAETIDELPRISRDIYNASAEPPELEQTVPVIELELKDLLLEFARVMQRADMFKTHQVTRDKLSTRERMTEVLSYLQDKQFVPFVELFKVEQGRLGVIVSFLAVMELIKSSLIDIVQNEAYGAIHLKAKAEQNHE